MTIASVKPVAGDDRYTFSDDQVISGNLLSNDTAGANGLLYLRSLGGSDVAAKVVGQITDIAGQYGMFHLKADGTFTYDLDPTVKASLHVGQSISEHLAYKVSDGQGHTDVGTLDLTVQGHAAPETTVLDFENLNSQDGGRGYYTVGDFFFNNVNSPLQVIPDNELGDSGYLTVSQEKGGNVGFAPVWWAPLDIYKSGGVDFDFVSGVFASAWDSAQDVTITGLRDGATVYSQILHLSNTSATTFTANWHDIDQIQIIGDGTSQVAMDDLTFAAASPMPV